MAEGLPPDFAEALETYPTLTYNEWFEAWLETSDEAEWISDFYKWSKVYGITLYVSASTSLIASSMLIWIIVRSHIGLSTTFHRLLLGICIGDIISSCIQGIGSFMVPRDVDYLTWNARGNMASCDAQGFLLYMGGGATLSYTASLLLYYLAVVKYQKKDEYIRTKIEPYMHGFSLFFPLAIGCTLLAKQAFNTRAGNCFIYQYNPPHCSGFEDGIIPDGYEIPCGRGNDSTALNLIATTPFICLVLFVIIISMILMYRAVLKHEKKMEKYGVGSLNKKSLGTNTEGNIRNSHESNKISSSISSKLKSVYKSLRSSGSPQLPPTRSQSRAVLYKAMSYSLAWLATWIFYFVDASMESANEEVPLVIWTMLSIFHPLQGFFNFLIYIYPIVSRAKRSKKDNLSWYQAFLKALKSKGAKKKTSLHSDGVKFRDPFKKKKQVTIGVEEEKHDDRDGLGYSIKTTYTSRTCYSSTVVSNLDENANEAGTA